MPFKLFDLQAFYLSVEGEAPKFALKGHFIGDFVDLIINLKN